MRNYIDLPRSLCVVSLATLTVGIPSALADLDQAPVIAMSVQNVGSGEWWGYDFNTSEFGDTSGEGDYFTYSGETSWTECDVNWEHDLEVDPGLGFGFTVTNNLTFTETFNLVAEVSVPGWSDGTLLGASVGGSVTDTNFDGSALLLGQSTGLLSAILDGSLQLEVGEDVVTSVDVLGGTSSFGPYQEGLGPDGADIIGPQVTDGVLRIELDFTLSAGDTASFSGGYVVEYVPAPGGLFALVGAAAFRRRRR